jgi:hypothetical protein
MKVNLTLDSPTCTHAAESVGVRTNMCTYQPTYVRTYLPASTNTYVNLHSYHLCTYLTYPNLPIPTYVPTYIRTCLPVYLRTYLPRWTYWWVPLEVHIQVDLSAFVRIYIRIYKLSYVHTFVSTKSTWAYVPTKRPTYVPIYLNLTDLVTHLSGT